MLLAILILSILFSTAEAVIPLRLVEEIQLPARTRTWDVEHVEDSTSFGWAALTDGATVWGVDSLGEDSLIAIAVDTIFYQTRTDGVVEQYLFSRDLYNPYYSDLFWVGLNLLKMPDLPGFCAVARNVSWWSESGDQFLHYFHLTGDSVLSIYHLYPESDGAYSIRRIESWPPLPQVAQHVIVSGSRHYSVDHAGCDESTNAGSGVIADLNSQTHRSIPCFNFDIYDRSDSLLMASATGFSSYWGFCEDPHYYVRVTAGSMWYSTTPQFQGVYTDTLPRAIGVVGQQDFDGTRRILYSNGNCYSASTGEVLYSSIPFANTTLSAYIRDAPGEDFLSFQSNRFDIYDGRTGEFVDSTTQIQGVPVKKFVGTGYDELLTFDNATKIVRIYQPYPALLTILTTENGQVELTWTESPGVIAYQLDRAEDSDFVTYSSDFFSPNITSITLEPQSGIEFFRVTPLFE